MSAFIASRTPGDRAILSVLILAIALASVGGALAGVRLFQIEVPAQGGALHEGVIGAPRFPHPLLATSEADRDLVALTYAGLMGYDAEGALVPVLAERYERSPDGTTYTFTLRSEARFSDGTPVTAEDVVFTIRAAQDPALKSPIAPRWAGVRAEVVDARTARIVLPQPYAPFLEEATLGILPRHIWADIAPEEVPFAPATAEPIGAGPFRVTEVVRTRDGAISRYRLAAFGGYVLGRPFLNRVELHFFRDPVALRAALDAGTVTSAYGAVREGVRQAPYGRVFGVFFNPGAYAPLENAAVRRALSLAIDREAIAQGAFSGYATAINGPLPPGSGTPMAALPGPDRVAQARAALADADWTFDEDARIWRSGTQELRISLVTSSVPELKEVAARVEADWEALGIPTEVVLYDPAELTQLSIRPRTYQALLFGAVASRPADLFSFWAGSERADPGLNVTGFANAEADRLMRELRAGTAADPSAAVARVEELIAAASPAAFLYTPDFLYAAPADLRGVALGQINVPSDRFRGIHAWYRYTEHVWPIFARGRTPIDR